MESALPKTYLSTLLAMLCLWSSLSLAAAGLEVIDLHYREASALIPLLQPLLPADVRLSGRGFQLIVRADAASLAEIRRLLSRLDTPPENLLISVRFDETARLDRSRARVEGGVVINDGRVNGGGRVVLGHTQRDRRSRVDQQLRVLEGYEALIRVSEEVLRRSYWGDYLDDAVTGFRVRPRLNGEQVILELTAQRERLRRRGVSGATTDTVISGPLGEWLPVALSRAGELAISDDSRQVGDQQIFMWVRVERP